ncbi:uncharacterized protein [Melanerpes formicivorus]|uniref:uncharacterized protein n=1 Tax=Melanerpes formicivorus TaxID=211600 RepID=UPI00358EF8F1
MEVVLLVALHVFFIVVVKMGLETWQQRGKSKERTSKAKLKSQLAANAPNAKLPANGQQPRAGVHQGHGGGHQPPIPPPPSAPAAAPVRRTSRKAKRTRYRSPASLRRKSLVPRDHPLASLSSSYETCYISPATIRRKSLVPREHPLASESSESSPSSDELAEAAKLVRQQPFKPQCTLEMLDHVLNLAQAIDTKKALTVQLQELLQVCLSKWKEAERRRIEAQTGSGNTVLLAKTKVLFRNLRVLQEDSERLTRCREHQHEVCQLCKKVGQWLQKAKACISTFMRKGSRHHFQSQASQTVEEPVRQVDETDSHLEMLLDQLLELTVAIQKTRMETKQLIKKLQVGLAKWQEAERLHSNLIRLTAKQQQFQHLRQLLQEDSASPAW